MRALLSRGLGREGLVFDAVPVPNPGAGQVRIRVATAGLNHFDTLTVRDAYQFRPPRPFAPGGEVAGVVDAVGARVGALKVGDRVVAFVGASGGLAEYVVASADHCVQVPAGVPFSAATALTITHGTAIHALHDRAEAAPGETLVVLGATSATGLAAVEIGVRMGLRVVAVGSSKGRLRTATRAGAYATIDYSVGDLHEWLKQLGGTDVVFDAHGGDISEVALRSLRWGGRHLVVGFPAGIPRIPLNLVLLKGSDVRGVFWTEFVERDPAAYRRHFVDLLDWLGEGVVAARVAARYPLEDGAAAIGDLIDRKVVGKVIIDVDRNLV